MSRPIRLDVDVDRLDPVRSQALVEHPERLSGLQDEVTRDVTDGTTELAVRSCVAVVSGATALGLAVYRRPRRALAAGGLALALLAASGVSAYATWNPKSVLEPKFSGLLSSAPSVVGNARSIVTEFDVYQQELARLVTNVTKLYDATSTLPAYRPDPATMRVLHVSDIHLNPAAWHIIGSLVEQYEIDVIIDSGDTMDHGTAAENGFLDPIPDLGAPYVWVRGNHDSAHHAGVSRPASRTSTSSTTAGAVNVGGPADRGHRRPPVHPGPLGRRPGRRGRARWRASGSPPPCATRSARARPWTSPWPTTRSPPARPTATVPLAWPAMSTTARRRSSPHGTRLKIEGSTGGGGLRAVQNEKPEKVRASVLYLDRYDPAAAGVGRDHPGRARADDGRGQPPSRRRRTTRARPRPRALPSPARPHRSASPRTLPAAPSRASPRKPFWR